MNVSLESLLSLPGNMTIDAMQIFNQTGFMSNETIVDVAAEKEARRKNAIGAGRQPAGGHAGRHHLPDVRGHGHLYRDHGALLVQVQRRHSAQQRPLVVSHGYPRQWCRTPTACVVAPSLSFLTAAFF
ncbi:hypothetical protein HPB51_023994 [Rhipicephalus microplus]|uniref:Uncharacterized protein n=1 Tax=Rhipicephalus microplus TaxID=6941 RepID=A0A9J6ED14_RHIMP|nr:hypothetical protein HPB51_023994 [Rhipicephalus microplus]